MRYQKFTTVLFLSLFALVACHKKDKEDDQPKTTAEKLQGKWILESVIEGDHIGGEDTRDTTFGTGADYFDFRSDGTVYVSFDGDLDSTTYSLQNDTKLILSPAPYSSVYDIQALTETDLKLSTRETDPSNPEDYYEMIVDLRK